MRREMSRTSQEKSINGHSKVKKYYYCHDYMGANCPRYCLVQLFVPEAKGEQANLACSLPQRPRVTQLQHVAICQPFFSCEKKFDGEFEEQWIFSIMM
jgi:hypothetical protein